MYLWFYSLFLKFIKGNDLSASQIEKIYQFVLTEIPTLGDSGLTVVPKDQLIFLNGICDLTGRNFSSWDYCSSDFPSNQIFNQISIPCEFICTGSLPGPPPKFDSILNDMFLTDDKKELEKKKKLAYQFIGAILAPTSWIKAGIFIFQGVNDAGKSILADIITHLLGEDTVLKVDDINNILSDESIELSRQKRLLYVREASDRRIGKKAINFLKDYSDKSSEYPSPSFKILICTNNPVYTASNPLKLKDELRKRINVLSFERALDDGKSAHEYIEKCFSNEKQAIYLHAMKNFCDFIQNDCNFITTCKINEVIGCDDISDNENYDRGIVNNCINDIKQRGKGLDLNEVLRRLYELTPDQKVNYDLPCEQIIREVNEVFIRAGLVEKLNQQNIFDNLKKCFEKDLGKHRKGTGPVCYNLIKLR